MKHAYKAYLASRLPTIAQSDIPTMKILVLPMSTEPILLRPASHDRQRYLLERRDGVVVPLIPADELPEDFKLKVQRTMTMDEAFASGLQLVSFEPQVAAASTPPNSSSSLSPAPVPKRHQRPKSRVADAVRQSRLSPPTEIIDLNTSELSSEPAWRALPRNTTSKSPDGLAEQHRVPDERLKRYCSHWVHYGNCDYTQQGCKFLHVMPDQETLRSIGFRTTPRWWLNRHMSGSPRGSSELSKPSTAPCTDQIDESLRVRSAFKREACRGSTTSSVSSSYINLIDLSPDLHAMSPSSISSLVHEPSPVHLGPSLMQETSDPQHETSSEPRQQASYHEDSPKLERGKDLNSPHLIRRKSGRREVYLPPKSRRSGRGKRGL
ncbi:hypothetical protein AMS68_005837 [Peltaster fructicola]|uniref:C3H1-type domain-containing protein n=1 Tax=Peltaster fructicola TaxID=286661 RepID=A0A6H0Y0Z6_9PEZI|nr:hypothetical protein AMS68_005837 [Peltaster fructicola]